VTAVASRPALRRDPAHGVVAGVCAGLARRTGTDVLVLRVAFLLAATVGGLGAVAYAVAWLALPTEPGTAPIRRGGWQVAAGAACLVLALLLLFREWGLWFSDALVWPLWLAATGGALLWRQSVARPAPADRTAPALPPADAEIAGREAVAGVYRGGFGVALVVGAALLFLQANGALGALRDVVLAVVVVLIGLALILAPFLWRLGRTLATERTERIRAQERAEVAAHLHDSVLQTLALVQKRSEDPRAVAALARRQERELRSWLSGRPTAGADESLGAALEAAAVEVEEVHGAHVEVVAVGDAPLDDRAEAVVAAAREALVNAAKFAGGAPIALYAEVADGRLQVFVRDRGPGFDPADVPPDRRGVRESIVGRMERHGGHAVVRSALGAGTEVELTMERP